MSQARELVNALKSALRARKITYADVARRLGVSEASIKRTFSRGTFTLERIEQVCDIAGVRIAELAQMAERAPEPITQLTPDQESQLLADGKLLLVTFMVLNGWSIEQIVARFEIDEHEVVGRLARLDKLGMIELLPGNRIRRLVARNFAWREDGPVASFFEREVKKDLLDSRFAGQSEHLRFVGGLMSRTSVRRMHHAIDELTRRFDELVHEDADLELQDKIGVGAVFAIRPWQAPPFRALLRERPAQGR